MRFRRYYEILPWLALGPVTGLLAWRLYRSARDGNALLACMYAVAILGSWIVVAAECGQAFASLLR